MPELPEVESTRQVLLPILTDNTFHHVMMRRDHLRYPIVLPDHCFPFHIKKITRRAKYLIISNSEQQCIVIHLGMSGFLSIHPASHQPLKHDHVLFTLNDEVILVFNDTRRFGFIQWFNSIDECPWFQHLGFEPLSQKCNIDYLYPLAQQSKSPIKTFIMNQKNLVGVGNIYASEALFLSGIHPLTPACQIGRQHIKNLLDHIKNILSRAIQMGGTTLKDYQSPDAKPGYFQQTLLVYNRHNQACSHCGTILSLIKINQRQSVFCSVCQPEHTS